MKRNISIIIPTANQRPGKLVRAIKSVINQSRVGIVGNTEIIVSNNSPRPPNVEVLDLAQRGIVQILDSSQTPGVSFARNRGAVASRFCTIAFLDDDDWWEKSFLLEMSEALVEKNVDVVYCGRWNWDTDVERRPGKMPGSPATVVELFVGETSIEGSNILLKKEVYLQLGGFDVTLPVSEDRDLFIRLLKHRYRFHAVQSRLVNMDTTPHPRLTQSGMERVRSQLVFYEKYAAEMNPETKQAFLFKLLRNATSVRRRAE
jgi:glycosyltransferase involved in cell wall biosynthesis